MPTPQIHNSRDSQGIRKEHACTYCSRTFRRAEHLLRHIRTRHAHIKDTREKPYICHCGAAFTRPDLLKRHRGLVHVDEEGAIAVSSSNVGHTWPSQERLTNDASQWGNHRTVDPVWLVPHANSYQDFADFMDNMGLPLDWDVMLNQPSIPLDQEEAMRDNAGSRLEDLASTPPQNIQSAANILPIPKKPNGRKSSGIATNNSLSSHLQITEEQMQRLRQSLAHYQHAVPGVSLPSRQALTRYIEAYFASFDPHLPFIHQPTFCVSSGNLEFVLAIACAGAQYRFEHKQAMDMFFASKSILNENIKERERLNDEQQATSTASLMDDARCLLCLIVFSAWKSNKAVFRASLSMQSMLVQCIREAGLTHEDIPNDHDDWHSWARYESDKRTKFLAFSFLNLMSHAYNQPPLLLADEINLPLPCSNEEWSATTQEEWRRVYRSRDLLDHSTTGFRDGLNKLITNSSTSAPLVPAPSALGSYILLHGLLQKVLVLRQACLISINPSRSLPSAELKAIERALQSWTLAWQQSPDSNLDPLNHNGPIPFTSTALLGLAYCRIYLDSGPFIALRTRNPHQIAQSILKIPPLDKDGSRLTHAVLHAAHSLSIPVKMGVEYVARSQGFFWSIQHALCCFELAVLLDKWLYKVAEMQYGDDHQTLNKQDTAILDWITQIVKDGNASMDDGDLQTDSFNDYYHLAHSAMNLWSHIMKGNIQWEIVVIMGQALEEYANLDRRLPQF